jgi:hypothetical protein
MQQIQRRVVNNGGFTGSFSAFGVYMRHIEDDHQKHLITWCDYMSLQGIGNTPKAAKIGHYLFAIPNGGKRNKLEAARMKGLGVRAGIADLMLALPLNGYAGLFIEMKAPNTGKSKPRMSDAQIDKSWTFANVGYAVCCCYGWLEAQKAICDYLNNQYKDLTIDNKDDFKKAIKKGYSKFI